MIQDTERMAIMLELFGLRAHGILNAMVQSGYSKDYLDDRLVKAVSYKAILKKYVMHVAQAEGECFACSRNMSPCDMGEDEFTEEEWATLEREILSVVRRNHEPPR